ncbi:MAG TPA: type II secretion system F family protein [Kineosporiaceae bacterium]
MGAALGLLAGVGLFCIWWSAWVPDPPSQVVLRPKRRNQLDAMRDVLVQAGVASVSLRAMCFTCGGLGAVVALTVLAVSQSPPIAASFGLIAVWLPVAAVRARARRRRAVLRELWPEVVDNLASGVRAGLSLPEALAQIGDRGPEPLRPAFAAFGRDYRVTGRFGESLDLLKTRLADPVADRICEALRITREVGGSDLGRLLRSLSAFLREDARTRAELQARQSWTVNAARLAVAAPWAVLGILATRPESVRAYNSGAGVTVLAVGAVLSVVAYRLMLRVARLPDEERVLR